jgi:hypothetical protein
MTIAEQVYELVRSLPDDQVHEVLLFAQTVLKKHEMDTETPEEKAERMAQWRELVRSTAGAWPDFPTLEEIRASEVPDSPRESW